MKCDVKNRHVTLVGNIPERRHMFTDPNTVHVGLKTVASLQPIMLA